MLDGGAIQIGASGGARRVVGGDVIIAMPEHLGEEIYLGYVGSFGVGPQSEKPGEGHVYTTYTRSLFSYNYFDVANSICNAIINW